MVTGSENLLGEFLGTMVLLVLGCGVCANLTLNKSKGVGGGWICIAFGWGFGVTFGVFTATTFGAPQADLNPAVTLAKTFAGVYTFGQFITTSLVQILGGIVGATIVWLTYLAHWEETSDPAAKLGIFSTAPAIRKMGPALLTEISATFFLMFLIWMTFSSCFGYSAETAANTFLGNGYGPYIVGMLIVALGLSLGGPTGYAMNPARDLGPRIAHAILPIPGKGGSDWEYAWVPVVGPLLGATLSYVVCSALGYFH
ncbi:MIP/aquaporin family protein [Selenomonas sp. KH1T6]|jgi:glycerol uptake facilitator protein|uniref:MIP/aquaporin family protein n=1 Tax=Selenomonas sp. KH1T6 TaxID=3158784 RepID=UPI0008A7B2D6|nr:glycerol uptake facilitator protein [Selenomonas ruminantium]